ncbi:MAG: glycosyltransferase family 4 protein [Bacteroidales bacterium]|nr:glycosyltransferase family 4 protein [Bacteroidales bacterium]
MSKKTIVLVTCWFPHKENPQAGSFVLDHAVSLVKSGLKVRIFYIYIHPGNRAFKVWGEQYNETGIPVLKLNIASRFWKFIYQWPLFAKKTVLSFSGTSFFSDVDIIHSHALFPAGFFGFQLAQKLQKPFVHTEHWSRSFSFLRKHPLGYYGKRVYQKSRAVIFVSEYLKQKIESIANIPNKFVIANPINGDLFHYSPKPDPAPLRFTLAAFWKKNGVKRGDLILDAFHEIQQETDLKFQLDFVGDGDLLSEYQQKADAYGLPVCFCGYKSKEKLAEQLTQSHFFIHATDFETFGIVIFEALKTGTPVLASRLKVFEPYIDNTNGFLSENTVKDWKDTILKAVQQRYDYAQIGKNFRQPFSEKEIAEQTNEVYDFVLKEQNH